MNVNINGITITNPDTAFFVSLSIIVQIALILASTVFIISCISPKRKDERPNRYFLAFIGLFVAYLIGATTFSTSSDLYKAETVKVDTVIVKDDVASLNYKYKGKQHSFDICLPNDDNSDLDYKLDGKEFSDDVTVTQFDDDEIKSLLKKVQSKKLVPYLELTESRERKIKINVGLLNLFFNSKEDVTSKYELSRIGVKFKESNVPNFSEDFK